LLPIRQEGAESAEFRRIRIVYVKEAILAAKGGAFPDDLETVFRDVPPRHRLVGVVWCYRKLLSLIAGAQTLIVEVPAIRLRVSARRVIRSKWRPCTCPTKGPCATEGRITFLGFFVNHVT
jgi:hypothetical protein